MQTKHEKEHEYTVEMQEAFYAEELEDRFELAAASPNLACWISRL